MELNKKLIVFHNDKDPYYQYRAIKVPLYFSVKGSYLYNEKYEINESVDGDEVRITIEGKEYEGIIKGYSDYPTIIVSINGNMRMVDSSYDNVTFKSHNKMIGSCDGMRRISDVLHKDYPFQVSLVQKPFVSTSSSKLSEIYNTVEEETAKYKKTKERMLKACTIYDLIQKSNIDKRKLEKSLGFGEGYIDVLMGGVMDIDDETFESIFDMCQKLSM